MESPDQHNRQEVSTAGETDSTPSPDFATLARRIARFSGNLLATAVIIILGLTLGKQVLTWWNAPPAEVSVAPRELAGQLDGFADPGLPHQLAFSDMPLLFHRSVLVGDEEAALAQLRDECRRRVVADDGQTSMEIKVDQHVLERLATYEPVEQGDGWRMVQHAGPVITVVAFRLSAATANREGSDASQKVESVVSWGLGLRALETEEEASSVRWTLFTCTGAGRQVDVDLHFSSPIPPGSRRTLAMQVEGGGALIGFAGQGAVSSNKEFFDESFSERGWSRTKAWRCVGSNWYAHFSNPGADKCDVQLRAQDDGGTTGILTMYSNSRDSEE
jgi:hypothetical protein